MNDISQTHNNEDWMTAEAALLGEAASLAEQLAKSTGLRGCWAQEVLDLRRQLRDKYETLLLFHLEAAAAHDIENHLWRNVFYAVIEYCRRKIQNRKRVNGKKAKKKKSKVNTKLSTFLTHAEAFYVSLAVQLQRLHSVNFALDLPITPPHVVINSTQAINPPNPELCAAAVHRVLIALGDLARYCATLCFSAIDPSVSAQQKLAESYYKKALRLRPNNGLPFNQLAVISQSRHEEFEAVYQYTRSLSCKMVYSSARENFMGLLGKFGRVSDTAGHHVAPVVGTFDHEIEHTLVNIACTYIASLHLARPPEQLQRVHESLCAHATAAQMAVWFSACEKKCEVRGAQATLLKLLVCCIFTAWELHYSSKESPQRPPADMHITSIGALSPLCEIFAAVLACVNTASSPLASVVHAILMWVTASAPQLHSQVLKKLWTALELALTKLSANLPARPEAPEPEPQQRRGPLYEERLLRGFEPTCAYVDSLPVDWRTADLRGPAASSCRLCMLKRIAVHLREPTTNAPPALLPLLAKFSAQPRAPPEPPPPTPPPSTPPPSTPPPPPADMEDNAETSPVLGDDEPEESQPSAEPEHGTGPMVIEDPFGFHVFKVQPASVAAAIDSPRRRGRRRPLLAEPPRALACPGWTPTPFRLFGALVTALTPRTLSLLANHCLCTDRQ
eukprot:TRINITY_DN2383_c0_g1_i3.p1 TRINITY_DN2383_c0_g1~~TRINITY_DN2383_c0_g1_i3.p1  ORF type:complete len:675 (-),score=129.69 TRINITY_DN2383_c0_g1_i3:183-2207(-)